jgi:hypothetical protein
MATIQHPESAHEEPPVAAATDGSPIPCVDRMLERAELAHDLIRAGFDGPLFLSYVVWPAPLSVRAA